MSNTRSKTAKAQEESGIDENSENMEEMNSVEIDSESESGLQEELDKKNERIASLELEMGVMEVMIQSFLEKQEESENGKWSAPAKRSAKGSPKVTPPTFKVTNQFSNLSTEDQQSTSGSDKAPSRKKQKNTEDSELSDSDCSVASSTSSTRAPKPATTKKLHSPDFVVSGLSAPKFEKDMLKKR